MLFEAKTIDLVVPTARARLPSIMNNYARGWDIAVNAGYFETRDNVTSYGLCIFWSRLIRPAYPNWPALVVDLHGGIDLYEQSVTITPSSVRHALAIGPVLIRGGRSVNLAQEITRGRFTGLRQGSIAPRTVIGKTQDGNIIIGCVNNTLQEAINTLLRHGCIWAIYNDGGSSSGVINSSNRVLFGSAQRRLPAAIAAFGAKQLENS